MIRVSERETDELLALLEKLGLVDANICVADENFKVGGTD